jgi:hypothetical protein
MLKYADVCADRRQQGGPRAVGAVVHAERHAYGHVLKVVLASRQDAIHHAAADVHSRAQRRAARYASIRQHTSAYASIRQHTPAHVSIRQDADVHSRAQGRAARFCHSVYLLLSLLALLVQNYTQFTCFTSRRARGRAASFSYSIYLPY